MAVHARVRFYREFLTPALHRKFVRAAGLVLILCYVESILIGSSSSLLWSWFPLGWAGMRALLLFIPSLLVFILRLAQLHLGPRMTNSPFESFRQYALHLNTLQTVIFYCCSALLFGEVFMWSAPPEAELSLVLEGRVIGRPILNERPIYFRFLMLLVGTAQALWHLYYNFDKVSLPLEKAPAMSAFDKPTSPEPPVTQLQSHAPQILLSVVAKTSLSILAGPFIYWFCSWRRFPLRRWAWTLHWSVVRLFYSVGKDSAPPTVPPLHWRFMIRCTWAVGLLLCLWDLSNVLFSSYVAHEPLKNSQPLTAESRDPNGSLLNGLKSKKQTPKAFAFWELRYITAQFEARRKSIFTEIDRAGGATWDQIFSVSLDPILSISDRIKDYHNPRASTAAGKQQVQVPIQSLPRISSPLRNDPVVLKSAPPSTNSEKLVGYAKAYIETPVPAKNIGPRVQQVIDLTMEKFGAKDQQNAYQAGTLMYRVHQGAMWILQSPFGGLFRQTFRRRLIKVILGTPYSQLTNIINAIDSIASLAVASLKEDQFGTANKDIANIIRTFTKTFQNIEAFAQGLPAHWTDIEFNATDRRVEEVELVKEHLKMGLGHILYAFGPYASEMGLKKSELVTAKQVAGLDSP